jgi:hypothetical protein
MSRPRGCLSRLLGSAQTPSITTRVEMSVTDPTAKTRRHSREQRAMLIVCCRR